MGLLDKIKSDVKKSGQNRGKFLFFRPDQKTRVRFLQDIDDGMEVPFHDSYEQGINQPCQEIYGKECDLCDDDTLRTRSMYCWSVWDYDAKEVKLFMFAVNNCSPIPALIAMYENYGTITDRDYVITQNGKGQNKTFGVVPMDKVKFRNSKAKAYSERQVLKMLAKAYPADDDDGEFDDEEVEEKPKAKAKKARAKAKAVEQDDYDDETWGDTDDDDAMDYDEMSSRELYDLCVERGIDVEKKKAAKYYIRALEEADKAEDDWADDDDDDWEDD